MWHHKKYKSSFTGSYKIIELHDGNFGIQQERVFVLTNGKKTISFESWQQAKKQGWFNRIGDN